MLRAQEIGEARIEIACFPEHRIGEALKRRRCQSFCAKGFQSKENKLKGKMERNGGNEIVCGAIVRKNLVKIKQTIAGHLLNGEVGNFLKRLFVLVDHRYLRKRTFPDEQSNGPASEMAASDDQVTGHGIVTPSCGFLSVIPNLFRDLVF